MSASAMERFQKAVAELEALKSEGYEIPHVHKLTMSATAKALEAEEKAKPAVPQSATPRFSKQPEKSEDKA